MRGSLFCPNCGARSAVAVGNPCLFCGAPIPAPRSRDGRAREFCFCGKKVEGMCVVCGDTFCGTDSWDVQVPDVNEQGLATAWDERRFCHVHAREAELARDVANHKAQAVLAAAKAENQARYDAERAAAAEQRAAAAEQEAERRRLAFEQASREREQRLARQCRKAVWRTGVLAGAVLIVVAGLPLVYFPATLWPTASLLVWIPLSLAWQAFLFKREGTSYKEMSGFAPTGVGGGGMYFANCVTIVAVFLAADALVDPLGLVPAVGIGLVALALRRLIFPHAYEAWFQRRSRPR